MTDRPLTDQSFPHLANRSFLTLRDFKPGEIATLIDLAASLKVQRAAGTEKARLAGKAIALIFEKDSTRTRIGFELAAYEQGMHVTYLGPTGSHIGHKETIKDTARVLGRLYDAIEYRGYAQSTVEALAKWAGVPVYNGLTDEFHPTQILADFLTMREHSGKKLDEISFCYLGDAANNMGDSLLIGGAKTGMDVRIAAPESLWPKKEIIEYAKGIAETTGAKLIVTENPNEGVAGAQFLYTDVWLSMGQSEEKWAERINLLKPYQVNTKLMSASGVEDVKFMHCLPAFHNADTEVGARIKERFGLDAMEVTEDVFESPSSIVFDQAENRMHTIKAVLIATIAGGNSP